LEINYWTTVAECVKLSTNFRRFCMKPIILMKGTVFWVATTCSLKRARRFGGKTAPSSGSKSKPIKKPAQAGRRFLLVGFSFGLLFDPENGCYLLIWNFLLPPNYMVWRPRNHNFSDGSVDLKSNIDNFYVKLLKTWQNMDMLRLCLTNSSHNIFCCKLCTKPDN
jgi:hypothetical protein